MTVCDVAPRDGLQNEDVVLEPAVRAELCRRLATAGLSRVEAASFVHPEQVPAMAGAEEVIELLDADASVTWTGLVLNERGFDRALAAGLRRINYTLAATESFCRRNQGSGREDAEALTARLVERGRSEDVAVTVTLAVAFGCPFEGRVPPSETLAVAERAAAAGPDELVLADTIGVAVPSQVTELLGAAAALDVRLGVHFHDTRDTAIANTAAALECGVDLFDASVGGTGGCPFAPNATGNVATEDVVSLFDEMGVETGVDSDALLESSEWLAERLGRAPAGAVGDSALPGT